MTAARSPAATREDGVLSVEAVLDVLSDASDVLTREAARADQTGTFPARNIELLRRHGLFSAGVPRQYGGGGFGAEALAAIARKLGASCGSTAMIWAMHHVQVACLARCASQEPAIAEYLHAVARDQRLIASATSEAGIGGDLRRSNAAIVASGQSQVRLEKQATTVSYAAYADSFLITARSSEQAAPNDQVLVLVPAGQAELKQTGAWNMLGMRGTCGPGFLIRAVVPSTHVLCEPFSSLASQCMIPLSHLLWAATWTGIATDAAQRAAAYSRAKMRSAAQSGADTGDPRLSQVYLMLTQIRDSLHSFADDYGNWTGATGPAHGELADELQIAVRANALKVSVSTGATRIAELAMQICGMAGYSEEGIYSVTRQFRDLHSAPLMISNSKLDLANSQLLLLREGEFRR